MWPILRSPYEIHWITIPSMVDNSATLFAMSRDPLIVLGTLPHFCHVFHTYIQGSSRHWSKPYDVVAWSSCMLKLINGLFKLAQMCFCPFGVICLVASCMLVCQDSHERMHSSLPFAEFHKWKKPPLLYDRMTADKKFPYSWILKNHWYHLEIIFKVHTIEICLSFDLDESRTKHLSIKHGHRLIKTWVHLSQSSTVSLKCPTTNWKLTQITLFGFCPTFLSLKLINVWVVVYLESWRGAYIMVTVDTIRSRLGLDSWFDLNYVYKFHKLLYFIPLNEL